MTGAFTVSILEIIQALEEAFEGLTEPLTGLFHWILYELQINSATKITGSQIKNDLEFTGFIYSCSVQKLFPVIPEWLNR